MICAKLKSGCILPKTHLPYIRVVALRAWLGSFYGQWQNRSVSKQLHWPQTSSTAATGMAGRAASEQQKLRYIGMVLVYLHAVGGTSCMEQTPRFVENGQSACQSPSAISSLFVSRPRVYVAYSWCWRGYPMLKDLFTFFT
jgi:hypothetical protein